MAASSATKAAKLVSSCPYAARSSALVGALCAGGPNAFHLAGQEAGARRCVLPQTRFAKAANCDLDGGRGVPMVIGLERLGKIPLAMRLFSLPLLRLGDLRGIA